MLPAGAALCSCCQLALQLGRVVKHQTICIVGHSATPNTRPLSRYSLLSNAIHSCATQGLAQKDKQIHRTQASTCLLTVLKRFLLQFVSSYHVQCWPVQHKWRGQRGARLYGSCRGDTAQPGWHEQQPCRDGGPRPRSAPVFSCDTA